MNESKAILEVYSRAQKTAIQSALATVIHVSGSSYRRPGAKMLILEDGTIRGSVSGGCLERDLIRRALLAIQKGEATIVRYDTRADVEDDAEGEEVTGYIQSAGLGCEGVIEIYLTPKPEVQITAMDFAIRENKVSELKLTLPDGREFVDTLRPPVSCFIFGAGHDSVAMSQLAMQMGWSVSIFDSRSSFPMPRRLFAEVDHYHQGNAESLGRTLKLSPQSVALVMTHNYEHDREFLRALLPIGLQYLGVLGPRIRTEKILAELEKEGITPHGTGLRFPMGFDLGGDTPESVALATLAEAQAVLSGRSGKPLIERAGPIHS